MKSSKSSLAAGLNAFDEGMGPLEGNDIEFAAAGGEECRIVPVLQPIGDRVRRSGWKLGGPSEHGKTFWREAEVANGDDPVSAVMVVHRLPEGCLLQTFFGVGVFRQSECGSEHLGTLYRRVDLARVRRHHQPTGKGRRE
jgi:hypothetical protein